MLIYELNKTFQDYIKRIVTVNKLRFSKGPV